jgi:hypothetical protein
MNQIAVSRIWRASGFKPHKTEGVPVNPSDL